jgi:hypothetical protein
VIPRLSAYAWTSNLGIQTRSVRPLTFGFGIRSALGKASRWIAFSIAFFEMPSISDSQRSFLSRGLDTF